MRFILLGFSQHMGYRMFSFEGIAEDSTRTPYTVKADTTLTRKYGITVQELPLLCRKLLERDSDAQPANADQSKDNRALTFTEQDMVFHAKDVAAAREATMQKRKWTPRPSSNREARTELAPAPPASS